MRHAVKPDVWKATVVYTAPNKVTVTPSEGKRHRGRVNDRYDPHNLAYPARLTTLLQGVTFFGPIHELLRSPQDYSISLVGEDKLEDKQAWVLHVQPSRPRHPLTMRVGCGIWTTWYGYWGRGADVDQVWIEQANGLVRREQGYLSGVCQFTADYGDFEEISGGKQVPRRVVVRLPGEEGHDPRVFDMRFQTLNGRVWLLEHLSEFSDGNKVIAAAELSGATADL